MNIKIGLLKLPVIQILNVLLDNIVVVEENVNEEILLLAGDVLEELMRNVEKMQNVMNMDYVTVQTKLLKIFQYFDTYK